MDEKMRKVFAIDKANEFVDDLKRFDVEATVEVTDKKNFKRLALCSDEHGTLFWFTAETWAQLGCSIEEAHAACFFMRMVQRYGKDAI